MLLRHPKLHSAEVVTNLLALATAKGDDSAAGLRLARQALALARREGAGDEALGQALLLQAHHAYRLFDYGLTYESALEASTVLERTGDLRRRGRALNYCFITCIEIGDLVRALEHLATASAVAENENNPAQRARLLHNQAVLLEMIEDYQNALVCLKESASLYDGLPHGEAGAFFARVNAAGIHLAMSENSALYSKVLSEAPGANVPAARLHREAAARMLPPLLPEAAPAALQMWLSIQTRLGNLPAARQAAVICIKKARRNPSSERYRTYAVLALADYHIARGQAKRGQRCLQYAVRKLRAARNQSHLSTTEHRLAALCAQSGDHRSALHWIRQAQADSVRLQAERDQVRGRFAASDREERRRRALSEEVQVHSLRLDVVGRLIAEIHHALARPLGVARERLLTLLQREDLATSMDLLRTTLLEVIGQVDAASALVGQLKMFSYRASPQPSEINLQLAMSQAWRDATLWRRGPPRTLAIESRHRTVVQVDAQRLAVLLRILLIEADRITAPRSMKAIIDNDDAMCCMDLICGTPEVEHGVVTVGLTLCVEIAKEIGGQLTWDTPGKGLAFKLHLPPMLSG